MPDPRRRPARASPRAELAAALARAFPGRTEFVVYASSPGGGEDRVTLVVADPRPTRPKTRRPNPTRGRP